LAGNLNIMTKICVVFISPSMIGISIFFGKWPHLLWAGSRAAHVKIIVSGKPNRLNFCVIFKINIHIQNPQT